MDVYVVWCDNREPYEDNHQTIEAIFSTREKAFEYIDCLAHESDVIKVDCTHFKFSTEPIYTLTYEDGFQRQYWISKYPVDSYPQISIM